MTTQKVQYTNRAASTAARTHTTVFDTQTTQQIPLSIQLTEVKTNQYSNASQSTVTTKQKTSLEHVSHSLIFEHHDLLRTKQSTHVQT